MASIVQTLLVCFTQYQNNSVFYSVPYFFAPVKADKKVVKLVAAPCGWEAGGARHMTRHINKLFYLYEIMKKLVNYLFTKYHIDYVIVLIL